MTGNSALIEALRSLGLKSGDLVFVHANLRLFGLGRDTAGQIRLEMAPADLLAALQAVVGETGTVAAPAFSTQADPAVPFDPRTAPTETGLFATHLLALPEARRTSHPMLSQVLVGAEAESLAAHADRTEGLPGYGPGSPYDALLERDALMLLIGVPLCSYKDHVETRLDVPYRYAKRFHRPVKRPDGVTEETAAHHFVRYRIGGDEVALATLWDGLTTAERAAFTTLDFGAGHLRAVRARVLDVLLTDVLRVDPYRFVTHLPLDRAVCDRLAAWRRSEGYGFVAEQRGAEERWLWHTPDGTIDAPGGGDALRLAAETEQIADFLSALAALPGALSLPR